MRYFARVEYDGTPFNGWQSQKNQKSSQTVQWKLEEALSTVINDKVAVVGAGRTDAGVHGRGQGIHFEIDDSIDINRVEFSVNSLLPKEIAIYNMQNVSSDFHARFSAKERTYRYFFVKRKTPLSQNRALFVSYKTDWDLFKKSADMLLGRHDFTAFCAARAGTDNMNCDILDSSLIENENGFIYQIKADRFVYKMVRSIVGTLIDISRGRLDYSIDYVISEKKRELVGNTAPAFGLVLEYVKYDEVK